MASEVTALVTGASQNIGRRIALTLAGRGMNVAAAARSDGIYETVDLMDDPDRGLAVEMDVTDVQSVEAAVRSTVDAFGGLDVLVNDAGVTGPTAHVADTTMDDWFDTFDVNLFGQVRTVKAALPHLRESERGRIVNLSSTAAKDVLPNRSPYNASKLGVVGLTRSLAVDLGQAGITVNAICPGATRGKRIERSIEEQAEMRDLSFEEMKARMFTDDAAMGVLVEQEDTAELVAFLASEEARYITGQDINVDAGTCWE